MKSCAAAGPMNRRFGEGTGKVGVGALEIGRFSREKGKLNLKRREFKS